MSVIPSHAELTTQQTADMLNVSRPFLIGLLESGKIPYRTVGRYRRITFEDLMEFKRHDDLKRRAAADELTEISQELDLFRERFSENLDSCGLAMDERPEYARVSWRLVRRRRSYRGNPEATRASVARPGRRRYFPAQCGRVPV